LRLRAVYERRAMVPGQRARADFPVWAVHGRVDWE
jgi:hypothetical protein